MHIDIAMPTHESGLVVAETLDALASAEAGSPVTVARLLIEDDESSDDTRAIARERAARHGWSVAIESRPTTLPEARQHLIERADTKWVLFCDDDTRVDTAYLHRQWDAVAPAVGAIQGRKQARTEPPSEWVRRRARRGGLHATLVRRVAARGVTYPPDLGCLEDEWLRRHIERRGYLWVFDHQARFDHANQDRHPIGWQEGYLAGKYGLKPFHECALNVPFSLATGRNPWPHAKRAAGWLAGAVTPATTAPTSPEHSSVAPTDTPAEAAAREVATDD